MRKGTIAVLLIIFSSYLGCGTAKDYIGVIKDRGVVTTQDGDEVTLSTMIAAAEGISYCAEYSLLGGNAFAQGNLDFLLTVFEGAEGITSLDQYNNKTCEDILEEDPSMVCDEIVYTQELENDVVQKEEDDGKTVSENSLWFSQEGVDDLVANISIYSPLATQKELEDKCIRTADRPMPFSSD